MVMSRHRIPALAWQQASQSEQPFQTNQGKAMVESGIT